MNNPQNYYKKKKSAVEKDKAELKKKSSTLAWSRGLLFIGAAILSYVYFQKLSVYWPLLVLALAVFLWLVKKYQEVKKQISFSDELININQTELDVIDGKLDNIPDGLKYLEHDHPYCHDIDLFGQGSFYQFINRTTTSEGSEKLADALKSNDIENIIEKQNEIKELAEKIEFRQDFSAQSLVVESKKSASKMVDWFQIQDSTIASITSFGQIIFSIISLGLIVASYLGFVDAIFVVYWFFIGLGLVSLKLKEHNKMANQAADYGDSIAQYSLLIRSIENENFTSRRLLEVKESIRTKDLNASQILLKLGKIINALNNRNSVLLAALLNGFFLYDYYWINKMKSWIGEHKDQLKQWFEAIYHIDATNSLAGFAYNHPSAIFPKLSSSDIVMKAQQLGHPQIPLNVRVDNDFDITKEQFIIITGANMAGKSTFLRTVALHIVMSNVGLPATAKSFIYRPIKLISSMRTSDSLKDQESYFFSELKRLKYIIEKIKFEEHFIILDEILKGTNSKDKEEGSKKFVKKLISTHATGIIATHDLSLCTLSEEHNEVVNKYFDAEIIDDELSFDYTFKDGVCQNMNASFLLKKMEIV